MVNGSELLKKVDNRTCFKSRTTTFKTERTGPLFEEDSGNPRSLKLLSCPWRPTHPLSPLLSRIVYIRTAFTGGVRHFCYMLIMRFQSMGIRY